MQKLLPILFAATALAHYRHSHSTLDNNDPELTFVDINEFSCPTIVNFKNISMKEVFGRWHLPFMSSPWVRYFVADSAVYGKGRSMKNSVMGRVCMKVNINLLSHGGTPNNTDASLRLQSKCLSTGTDRSLACAPYKALTSKWYCTDLKGKNPTDDSFVIIADTDGKTWALVIRCFMNDDAAWAIFSKVKRLSRDVVKLLLKKVEAMGFKIFNVVEVPYEKCMTNPQ